MVNYLRLFQTFSITKGKGPAYRQLARFCEDLWRSGLLAAGDKLPAERELAMVVGISRTTVTAAYAELIAKGLAEARVGTGTFLTGTQEFAFDDDVASPPWAQMPRIMLEQVLNLSMESDEESDGLISFVIGAPAKEMTPANLPDAMGMVFKHFHGQIPSHGAVEGLWELRLELAKWTTGGKNTIQPDEIMVTTGSQQGLYLIAQTLLRPGDAVLVQSPCFFGALQLFKSLGAYLVEFDPHNSVTKSLLDQLRKHNPKLIYVNPTFQNPTGEVLDIDDRLRILTLARELQVPVVDDDPYRELWFAKKAPPRLRDLSPHPLDPVVITLGTVSKLLSPALRLGWIVASRIVLNRLSKLKQISDLHTSLFAQTAVLFYLQEERLELHMKDIRIRYQARRDKMIDALHQYLPQGEFRVPQGGFYVWCKLPGISSSDLYYSALEQGVAFVPGPSFFSGDGGEEWLRLSYASPPTEAIEEGIKRLSRAMQGNILGHD